MAHLDTSNSEFNQGPQHLSSSDFVSGASNGALDQKTVIMRLSEGRNQWKLEGSLERFKNASYSDLGTGETRTGVQSNTVSTSTSVHFDLSSIRLEVGCSVFSGDSTLDSETSSGNVLLGQTQGSQSGASGDLDLSGNDVDTRDFLCEIAEESDL